MGILRASWSDCQSSTDIADLPARDNILSLASRLLLHVRSTAIRSRVDRLALDALLTGLVGAGVNPRVRRARVRCNWSLARHLIDAAFFSRGSIVSTEAVSLLLLLLELCAGCLATSARRISIWVGQIAAVVAYGVFDAIVMDRKVW